MKLETQKSWSKAEFGKLNSLYRKGDSDREVLISSAQELFRLALEAVKNPKMEELPDVLNSMVVSFEILENYFVIPVEMDEYFKKVVDNFCQKDFEVSIQAFKVRLKRIFSQVSNDSKFSRLDDPSLSREFCQIATQYILVNLCGINLYYRENEDENAQEKLKVLFKYIRCLNSEKGKDNDLSSSLYALAKYFEGKILFAQAEYQEAIGSFQECSQSYLNKLLLTVDNTLEAYLTRMVATRRYALSIILGQAYILQSQGKLNQAKELCEASLPLLSNTNLVLKTYSEFIYQIVLRGLDSSNATALNGYLTEFERIKKIFINELSDPRESDRGSGSHYVQRCELEICLVKLYLAKTEDDINKKITLFSEVKASIESVLDSRVCQNIEPNGKNSRLKASAYTLLSYCLREYPVISGEENGHQPSAKTGKNSVQLLKREAIEIENCQNALTFAHLAIKYSDVGKKSGNDNKKIQAYCDALIERGLVHKKLYELYLQIYKRNSRIFSLNGEQSKGLLAEAKNNKYEAVKNLFDALQSNLSQKNERIDGSAWLQLTSIELLDLNLLFCEYNYRKYEDLTVEHDYLIKFSDDIKVAIERLRLYAPPLLMGENENNYNRQEWMERIDNYLVEKIVFQTVLDLEGQLPSKEFNDQNKKGKEKNRIYEDFGWKKNTSRRSLLIDEFKNKLGLPEKDAISWAKRCTGYFNNEDNLLEKVRKKFKEVKSIDSKIVDLFFGVSDLRKSIKIVFAFGRLDEKHLRLMQRNLNGADKYDSATPEGITAWIPSDDLDSAHELIKLLALAGKDVKYVDDDLENIGKDETSIISYGLFNRFAMYMSEFCQKELFQIKFKESPRTGKLTDNFEINGICPMPDKDSPDEDYAMIARIVSNQKSDKTRKQVRSVSIIVAGRTAAGTSVSGRFLNQNLPGLLELYTRAGKDLTSDSMAVIIKHSQKGTDGNSSGGSIATNGDLQRFSGSGYLGKEEDFFIHWGVDESSTMIE